MERLNRFVENALDLKQAIGFGRIEERHAAFERCADDGVHVLAPRDGGLIGAAHVLDAKADGGYLQHPQPAAIGERLTGCSRA